MSISGQMYLQTVYLLQMRQTRVRVTDIAKTLSVSKASVCKALGTLARGGYIAQQPYGDVHMTQKGQSEGARLMARYRPMAASVTMQV